MLPEKSSHKISFAGKAISSFPAFRSTLAALGTGVIAQALGGAAGLVLNAFSAAALSVLAYGTFSTALAIGMLVATGVTAYLIPYITLISGQPDERVKRAQLCLVYSVYFKCIRLVALAGLALAVPLFYFGLQWLALSVAVSVVSPALVARDLELRLSFNEGNSMRSVKIQAVALGGALALCGVCLATLPISPAGALLIYAASTFFAGLAGYFRPATAPMRQPAKQTTEIGSDAVSLLKSQARSSSFGALVAGLRGQALTLATAGLLGAIAVAHIAMARLATAPIHLIIPSFQHALLPKAKAAFMCGPRPALAVAALGGALMASVVFVYAGLLLVAAVPLLRYLSSTGYDPATITRLIGFLLVHGLLLCARNALEVFLQAGGGFSALARTHFATSVMSVPIILLLGFSGGVEVITMAFALSELLLVVLLLRPAADLFRPSPDARRRG